MNECLSHPPIYYTCHKKSRDKNLSQPFNVEFISHSESNLITEIPRDKLFFILTEVKTDNLVIVQHDH